MRRRTHQVAFLNEYYRLARTSQELAHLCKLTTLNTLTGEPPLPSLSASGLDSTVHLELHLHLYRRLAS